MLTRVFQLTLNEEEARVLVHHHSVSVLVAMATKTDYPLMIALPAKEGIEDDFAHMLASIMRSEGSVAAISLIDKIRKLNQEL